MRNYYITGLSGFLGQALLEMLKKDSDSTIHALILDNDPYKDYLSSLGVKLYTGNILDINDVSNFLSHKKNGENIVIHMAGRISTQKRGDPLTRTINVEGTRNMIEESVINHMDKFIYISSVDSLDKRNDIGEIYEQDEYHLDKVDGVYSKSKVEANNIVLSYKDKIHVNIILPSALIGPNDTFHSPINDALRLYLKGKMPAIVKGGYNLVDVRDVAYGIYQTSILGKKNESYLMSGTYLSVKELMAKVGEYKGLKKIKFTVPHFLIKIASPFIELMAKLQRKKPLFTGFSMDCLVQNSNYSSNKASQELGYKIRDIDITIKDTVDALSK